MARPRRCIHRSFDFQMGPLYPDFKHRARKDLLWIDGCFTSCCFDEEIGRRGLASRDGVLYSDYVSVTHPLPCYEESSAFVASLRACAKNKDLLRGIRIHNDVLQRGLLKKCSDALVTMYAKCGELAKAKELLDMHKSRDVFSWTHLIQGYVQKGQGQDALDCFEQMQLEGLSPDAVTFICILKACGSIRAADKGEQIHDEIARQGLLGKDIVLGNALVDMYVKCGALAKARRVLEEIPVRDVVSYSALIAGYAQQGRGEQALSCLEQMQLEGLSPNAVTFVCILKACGSIGAVDKGEQIHDEIARQGLLGNNIVLSNALVNMYAKCGSFTKAQEVLEEFSIQDVVSWNALIAGHAQHGHAKEALNCFKRMRQLGLFPDTVTFACILKACSSIGALDKGEQIHEEIAGQCLVGNNIVLGNALVDMYAKCGALAKAQRVLEELPVQNVVSWNALITGYSQQGQGEQSLNCFERMQREGFSPDPVTFLCILKACGSIGAVHKGAQVHDEIARQGLVENDIVLGNGLVDMYVKCGALAKARRVLEELPIKDVVSWNILITGYAQQDLGEEALNCFELMKHEGFFPNPVTFLCILKACGSSRAAEKGKQIHDEISREGLLKNNIVLGTALVDMYAKSGALIKAQQVLHELPFQNVVAWNALIAGYAQQGQAKQALDCLEWMQHNGLSPDVVTYLCILKACGSTQAADRGGQIHDEIARQGFLGKNIVLGNALIDMYAKCGAFEKAQHVLEGLPVRDIVSWSALIAGYSEQGQGEEAFDCFEKMQHEGLSPTAVTFISILKACGSIGAADKGQQIHDEIARQGLLVDDVVLGSSLVDMYAKCGALLKAQQVLEELPVRNAVSWNALIAGYVQQKQAEQALNCFKLMKQDGLSPDVVTFSCILKACGTIGAAGKGQEIHDEIAKQGLLGNHIVLGNALVDMHAKCGDLLKARQVFDELLVRDVVSWSALIAGYAQQGQGEEALNCFEQMQRKGFSPNVVTFLCILKACGSLGAAHKGDLIYDEIARQGLLRNDIVLGTALVDMYAKCGVLAKAQQVLEKLFVQDVASWNALIAGYAQQGYIEQALNCFEWMHCKGFSPDEVTFSCILKACGSMGLVDDALKYFVSMSREYGIIPDSEHYTSIIDVFGRAGHLDKAVGMIQKMPSCDHSIALWSALLGACQKLGDVNVGKWAFEHALQVDQSDAAPYVLMANIYAAAGMQGDAESIEVMRVENEAQQSQHLVSDEIFSQLTLFVGDTRYTQNKDICGKL